MYLDFINFLKFPGILRRRCLTLKNSAWWLLSVFVISEQAATFTLYIISSLVFITVVESVYSAVRTDYYTGRFVMFSVITNIYNRKTRGSTLMELFTATGKLKKFSF